MKIHVLVIAALSLILFSCTHSLHVVHTSDVLSKSFSEKRGRKIEATAEQETILGIVSDTNYVDQAWNSLQSKCSNGQIHSVLTRYSSSHGFFSWTNTVKMQAVCVR